MYYNIMYALYKMHDVTNDMLMITYGVILISIICHNMTK